MNTNELEFEQKQKDTKQNDESCKAEYTVRVCDICHCKIDDSYHGAHISFSNPELIGSLHTDYTLCRECTNALSLWVYQRLGLFNQK